MKLSSQSADIISWSQELQDLTEPIVYMEEIFSPVLFGCVVIILLSSATIGGSIFASYKGRETSTQSWLTVISLLFAVLLFGLSPCLMRRL